MAVEDISTNLFPCDNNSIACGAVVYSCGNIGELSARFIEAVGMFILEVLKLYPVSFYLSVKYPVASIAVVAYPGLQTWVCRP